uniref:Uncharacterized protein n=1 Tax=Rhizophora mucronata TaxID=61149 RepID=A0A2P2M9A4_RHIMU
MHNQTGCKDRSKSRKAGIRVANRNEDFKQ